MTSQEVNAAIRQSLGLSVKPEPAPTVPQEGHICDFPIWSYFKKRSTITKLTTLNLSEFVVNRSWCTWTCEGVAEAPLFSQDWG